MEMKTEVLVIEIIFSIIIIISGAYLVSYVEIGTETLGGISIPTATKPYELPGYIFLLVGAIMLVISVVLLVGIVLIREAKASPSARRR